MEWGYKYGTRLGASDLPASHLVLCLCRHEPLLLGLCLMSLTCSWPRILSGSPRRSQSLRTPDHEAVMWPKSGRIMWLACLSLWRPSMGLLICLIIYLKKRRKERKVEKNTKRSNIRTSWKVNLTVRYFYNYPLSDLTPRPRPSVKKCRWKKKKDRENKEKEKKKLFTTFGILSTTTCDFVIL